MFLDCGKYSTEQEGNCLRFFALQTVSANAMRIAFDNMQPIQFEDKMKDFKQNCKSNSKMKELSSIKYSINNLLTLLNKRIYKMY